jgi:hypothetical protein
VRSVQTASDLRILALEDALRRSTAAMSAIVGRVPLGLPPWVESEVKVAKEQATANRELLREDWRS